MIFKSFEEWVSAAERAYLSLFAVQDYLNDDGKERLRVFQMFVEVSGLARTADDMLELIKTCCPEIAQSRHAGQPIRALEQLVKNQKKGEKTA